MTTATTKHNNTKTSRPYLDDNSTRHEQANKVEEKKKAYRHTGKIINRYLGF